MNGFSFTPDEEKFLESTLKDKKLYNFLYTKNDIKVKYPEKAKADYRQVVSTIYGEYQRAHQTLRRLMNKSPYAFLPGQMAYTIVRDSEIPLSNLDLGTKITFGYKILFTKPKYDIGKHNSLFEIVFQNPIKYIPVGDTFSIMDEDHVFEVEGFERRALTQHPSHGVSYHIDLFRISSIGEFVTQDQTSDESRVHLLLDEREKPNLLISSENWSEDSVASGIVKASHDEEERKINSGDFARFKKDLGQIGQGFSDELLTVLYRVSERKRTLITKLLFEIHSHSLKLSHVIYEFNISKSSPTEYSDLEEKISETLRNLSKELDAYFKTKAQVTSAASTIYQVVNSKHLESFEDKLGGMIMFDNFTQGYTSTDSIIDRVSKSANSIILTMQIPPGTPVLIIPEHTGGSKQHRAVILPRNAVFQLEDIKSIRVLEKPKTFRKTYVLRLNRFEPQKTEFGSEINSSHLLQIEPELLSTIMKK